MESFNLKETKRKVNHYFMDLERLEWEQARLSVQKGLTAQYDIANENDRQEYVAVGKDEFNLSAKEIKAEELKKYIISYYWAKSVLSDNEKLYIKEYFINHKYDEEITAQLNFNNIYNTGFRQLKLSAIYKFADFLNLLVEKC